MVLEPTLLRNSGWQGGTLRADSALVASELDSILECVMQLYPDPEYPRRMWAKKNLLAVGKAGQTEADN